MRIVTIVFVLAFVVACSSDKEDPFVCADTGQIYSDSEVLAAGIELFNKYGMPSWTDTFSIAPLNITSDKETCCWVYRAPENKSSLEKIRDMLGFEPAETIIEANIKFSATPRITTEQSKNFWERYKDDRESLWTIEYAYSVNECLKYVYASQGAYPARN